MGIRSNLGAAPPGPYSLLAASLSSGISRQSCRFFRFHSPRKTTQPFGLGGPSPRDRGRLSLCPTCGSALHKRSSPCSGFQLIHLVVYPWTAGIVGDKRYLRTLGASRRNSKTGSDAKTTECDESSDRHLRGSVHGKCCNYFPGVLGAPLLTGIGKPASPDSRSRLCLWRVVRENVSTLSELLREDGFPRRGEGSAERVG